MKSSNIWHPRQQKARRGGFSFNNVMGHKLVSLWLLATKKIKILQTELVQECHSGGKLVNFNFNAMVESYFNQNLGGVVLQDNYLQMLVNEETVGQSTSHHKAKIDAEATGG